MLEKFKIALVPSVSPQITAFIQEVLGALSVPPDITLYPAAVSEGRWNTEILGKIMRTPISLIGDIQSPRDRAICPEDVLLHSISAHTQISLCLLMDPVPRRLYLVHEPWPAQGPAYAAFILALSFPENPTVYCTGFTEELEALSSLYPQVQIKTVSMEEVVGLVLKSSIPCPVILTTQEQAHFLKALIRTLYPEEKAMASVSIGAETVSFPLPISYPFSYTLASLALVLRYMAYTQMADRLEALILVERGRIRMTPELKKQLLTELQETQPDPTYPWGPLSCRYHHMEGTYEKIIGFDIIMPAYAALEELGQTLQEIVRPFPFELLGIAAQGIRIYPASSITPLFCTPWQCRFLSRNPDQGLTQRSIGQFIEKFSALYPWDCITPLTEAASFIVLA